MHAFEIPLIHYFSTSTRPDVLIQNKGKHLPDVISNNEAQRKEEEEGTDKEYSIKSCSTHKPRVKNLDRLMSLRTMQPQLRKQVALDQYLPIKTSRINIPKVAQLMKMNILLS